jgi:hypothetical protein
VSNLAESTRLSLLKLNIIKLYKKDEEPKENGENKPALMAAFIPTPGQAVAVVPPDVLCPNMGSTLPTLLYTWAISLLVPSIAAGVGASSDLCNNCIATDLSFTPALAADRKVSPLTSILLPSKG